MANMSDVMEFQLMSHIFGTGTFSKPPAIAIALTVTPPNDADTGASSRELPNQGAYARQALTQNATNWTDPVGTNGTCWNLTQLTYPAAQSEWGWISGCLVCTSATYGAGTALIHGTLTTPKYIGSGDQLIIPVSGLQFVAQ